MIPESFMNPEVFVLRLPFIQNFDVAPCRKVGRRLRSRLRPACLRRSPKSADPNDSENASAADHRDPKSRYCSNIRNRSLEATAVDCSNRRERGTFRFWQHDSALVASFRAAWGSPLRGCGAPATAAPASGRPVPRKRAFRAIAVAHLPCAVNFARRRLVRTAYGASSPPIDFATSPAQGHNPTDLSQ